METTLGIHQGTYNAIFQHPIARHLTWRDVYSMLGALPDVTLEDHNETVKVSRSGRTLVMHRPLRKNMDDVQELMNLRRFLEQTEAAVPKPREEGAHVLVVIDHRMARIYKTEFRGSVPEQIVPYDAAGTGRHLHYVQDENNGQRKPEPKSFYTAIAKTLERADKILLFGSGTGTSSAMEQLVAELDRHHKAVRQRVIASVVVDQAHLTEDQLLAKARAIYAELETSESNEKKGR
jgi:hypothetical protein